HRSEENGAPNYRVENQNSVNLSLGRLLRPGSILSAEARSSVISVGQEATSRQKSSNRVLSPRRIAIGPNRASARRSHRPKRRMAVMKAQPSAAHETTSPLNRFIQPSVQARHSKQPPPRIWPIVGSRQ